MTALHADHDGEVVQTTGLGTATDHQRPALRNPRSLVTTALRTKSVHAREILATLAWPGHAPAEVEQWAGDAGRLPVVGADQDAAWLARYAQVLAVQLGDPAERHAARRMLEAVLAAGELTGRARELLHQLRLVERDPASLGDLGQARRMRPEVRDALLADRANPWLFDDGDLPRWESAFNKVLHSTALANLAVHPEPVRGWEGAGHPLDRLHAPALTPVRAPYLVTVLMSCFQPGPELETAVRAVLDQTWTNLELFLIDDASGPESASFLEEIAGRDPRIRLIRKAVNGGTYRARNTALRVASGEFVTTLDSDDYLHPQAIEMGMRLLLAHPGVLATRSLGVRVTPDLELTRPGYLPRMRAAGTLLFRRREVMDRIGWFDHTSKGADTEFAHRLTAAFGPVIQDVSEAVLLLRDGDTLSSGEFSMGWRHGARFAYKVGYHRWHEAIAEGRADAFLDPAMPRPFPEPRRWAKPVVRGVPGAHHVQVCFAGDWRRYGGPQRSMLEEIAACREAGLSVAVMHLEAFRFMTAKDLPLCDPVMDLIESGDVEWLQPDDDARVEVLILRYPPILQYPPRLDRDPVQVGQLLIVANQAPMELDGTDQRYVVQDVTERATELFGVAPVWVPQGAGIREVLGQHDPDVALTPWDNPGLIDVDRWHCRDERAPDRAGVIVIGRHSRDDHIKFPGTFAELRTGYDFPEGHQVRFMGSVRTIPALMTAEVARQDHPAAQISLPENWELLPGGAVEVPEFLAGLDFFLYLDNAEAHEAFGRVILEAATSGVLTIVHPKHRVVFGDAVDYAAPGEAQALIAHYVADPDAYRERVRRSRALVAQRYGHAGFVERILGLLPAASRSDGASAGHSASGAEGQVSVRPTGIPTAPVVVETGEGTATLSMPLRALSDGSRADQVVIVHPAGEEPRGVVLDWLRRSLTGPLAEGVGWLGGHDAPAEVLSIVMVRDRTVRWSSRQAPPARLGTTVSAPGGTTVSAPGGTTAPGGRADGRADVSDSPRDGWWATTWSLTRGP